MIDKLICLYDTPDSIITLAQFELNGGIIHYNFSELPIVAYISGTTELINELSTNKNVKFISDNTNLKINNQSILRSDDNWGLDRIDQRDLPLDNQYKYSRSGSGASVYLFDTGIINHEELYYRNKILYDCHRAIDDPDYGLDDNGHGTGIASIIAGTRLGVAKKTRIISIKVADRYGNCTALDLIKGINQAIIDKNSNNIKSIFCIPMNGEQNNVLNYTIEKIVELHIPTIISSGNEGQPVKYINNNEIISYSPASVSSIYKPIVVGATTISDRIWINSNHGELVDVLAPGENVYTASIDMNSDSLIEYQIMSGTSISAAFVTGVVSLYIEDTNKSPSVIRQWLIDQSTKDKITDLTSETPNRLLYQPYREGNIVWITPSGNIYEGEENSSLDYNLLATTNITSSDGNNPIKYTLKYPSIIFSSGFLTLTADGNIKGFLPSVEKNQTDEYNFIVIASDGVNQDIEQEFNIKVYNKNIPLYWATYPGKLGIIASENSNINFQFSTYDPDQDIITYTLHSGILPPGLTLSTSGLLSGTVGNIPYNNPVYSFTLRATDQNLSYVDAYFEIDSIAINQPIDWDQYWLPEEIGMYPLIYRDLGTYQRLSNVNINILINNPDNIPLSFELNGFDNFIGSNTDYNGIIPNGLKLDINGGFISGIVQSGAGLGDYYFNIIVKTSLGDYKKERFRIRIIENQYSDTDSDLLWCRFITPSGLLGTIIETYPSHINVIAESSDGTISTNDNSDIIFSITPGSPPLPNGLTIDPYTGNIIGISTYVSNTTTYNFSLRASKGLYYSDRIFSIKILKWFNKKESLNVKLSITGYDRKDIIKWYNDTIPKEYLFRKNDNLFNIHNRPSINIVSGLNIINRSSMQEVLLNKYHSKKLKLILGELKSSIAYDIESNKPIYEILYRDIIDYQKDAGGYSSINNEEILKYPQSNTTSYSIDRFYPNSINNIRLNFINTIGKSSNLEPVSLWMMSNNNSNISISYKCVLELAILKLGTSKIVIDTINNKDSFIGMPNHFRQYVIGEFDIEKFNSRYVAPPPSDIR